MGRRFDRNGLIVFGSLCALFFVVGAILMGISNPPSPKTATFFAGIVLLAIGGCFLIPVLIGVYLFCCCAYE